jgi:hypothetical protein
MVDLDRNVQLPAQQHTHGQRCWVVSVLLNALADALLWKLLQRGE